ncbi:unnamed protein product [Amoebophrya sp. A25]|nr:unnamed protein product [Amoebophrya sp. A25]|eukprot:GSA25T00000875001.1
MYFDVISVRWSLRTAQRLHWWALAFLQRLPSCLIVCVVVAPGRCASGFPRAK